MSKTTESLGGYQHIVEGVIEPGDKVTFLRGLERCVEPVENALPFPIIGFDIEAASLAFELNVYRKIAVPHPGDIGHGQEVPGLEAVAEPMCLGDVFDDKPEHYIPQDSAVRKSAPMFRGLLGYFPAALFEVARHSMDSDKKHNPEATDGPTWARGKSTDHADCIVRHLIDAGDHTTGNRIEHLRALAWRSLALLQEECENQGAKPGVSSRHD